MAKQTPTPAPLFERTERVQTARSRKHIEIPGFLDALEQMRAVGTDADALLFRVNHDDEPGSTKVYTTLRTILNREYGTGDDCPFRISKHPDGWQVFNRT